MKTKTILILALVVAAFSSCRKGDDLYVNPNAPLTVTPGVMLTGIEANTFMNYEGGMARIASIMVQHNSGTNAQYTAYDLYILLASDMDNYWPGLYVGAMKNCKLLISQFDANYPYYGGIAHVNLAINLGIATQLWGDVPYKEAFNFENTTVPPHYDAQKDVLAAVISELNAAIADFSKSAAANQTLPGGDDLIFGGDITKWTKTAWVLKARFHNLYSKSDPAGSAANVIADLTGGNAMASNADNCKSVHNSSSDPNQWATFQDGRGGYLTGCSSLIDSLGNMADPRTPWYYDTTGVGKATGNPLGTTVGGSNLGPYLYNSADNLSTPIVTYAESQFLLAEAYARSANPLAAATLNIAIEANISDVTSGASTGVAQATYTPLNTTVHTVMLEKWKAMFGQPLEAYADYRRTGFPALKVRPGATYSFIPMRFPTPLGELTGNPNAKVITLNTPVWFAQ